MYKNDFLKDVYAKTNGGLDIITGCLPEAAAVVGNKKKFRLRSEERTPSACLLPPKDGNDYWRVVDYGGGEGERVFSPIDIYMRDRGYSQSQFILALHELMEMYGVTEELNPSVNKPEISQRDAFACETGQPPQVKCREGFTDDELRTWGPLVTAEHLKSLGWKAVVSITTTKGNTTTIRKSTAAYPIFAQACEFTDESGNVQQFQKIYEPCCFNKAFRFFIVGKKPQHYIFGLAALRRQFEQRGEEKLDEVVLVSGGSDAANCLSMGYQPVWLGSETEELRVEDMRVLLKYARRIVNIPDIDATGIKMGRLLAQRYPTLYTAWMTSGDMGYLHDNRHRPRKDLKDFVELHPYREDMQKLIGRAKCAQYWSKVVDGDGNASYMISAARLNYYLALNGYYTIRDDNRKEPVYIHIDGVKVKRVVAKSIVNFITEQAAADNLDEALQNKLMRSHDLPTNNVSHLTERSDLDFTKSTSTSQRLFFRNCWVEVTAQDIKVYRYSELNGSYVWEDAIIQHDYRQTKPMFSVEKTETGSYCAIIDDVPESKFFRFVINASRLYWRKETEGNIDLTEDEMAEEQQCLVSKLACIGYLLFSCKTESECWAPICQDSRIGESEQECNGGSGKSFFLKAISQLLDTFYIDAHLPTVTDNRFLFDGVTEDTDLIIVDECDRKLNLDFFFGRITGDLKGEEKGNHPFQIPFARSPKFAFATNYVLSKHDPSTERRIWPQVFSDYYHVATRENDYHETRTIRDDLGCNIMGTEYSEQDWQADIAFLLQCLQFYLSLPQGERRIMPPMQRIERREQMAAVGKDFKQWADEYFDSTHLDTELKAEDILNAFNNETRYNWSPKKLNQHLKAYCELAEQIHCFNPAWKTGKPKDGERWQQRDDKGFLRTYYYIESTLRHDQNQPPVSPTEEDIPF